MCRSCSISVSNGCCTRATGYYCFYDLRDRAMETEEWAELSDFRKLIRAMKFSNYSIGSVRQGHFRSLENLRVEAPFSQTMRFPAFKQYVNISCSRYSDLLRQICSALSYKERDREMDRRAGVHVAGNGDHSGSNLPQQDSTQSFYSNVESIYAELCKRTEVYDRLRFETKYDLKWCAGKPPSKPKPPDGGDGGDESPVHPPEWTWVQLRDAIAHLSVDPEDYRYIQQYPSYLVCGKPPSKLPTSGTVPTTATARIVTFTQADYDRCSLSTKMPVVIFDEFEGVATKSEMAPGDSMRQRYIDVRAEKSDSEESSSSFLHL